MRVSKPAVGAATTAVAAHVTTRKANTNGVPMIASAQSDGPADLAGWAVSTARGAAPGVAGAA